MKTFLTILMALFISHISFATNVPNTETGFNGEKRPANSQTVNSNVRSAGETVLPCSQSSTQTAALTFKDCSGNMHNVSSTVTCSRERETCSEALFEAAQCAFNSAMADLLSLVPLCPPVE